MSCQRFAWPIIAALAACLPLPAVASIGEIFFVEGTVQVTRAGLQSPAATGFELESGDLISTGADSQVRMHLKDDSYFALPANSKFKIDEFSMAQRGRKRKPSTGIFSLLRGGLRTISGLVGSWTKDTYRVNTPVVTMGIRGTEFSLYYCEKKSCPDIKNGSYIEVLAGGVKASNKEGAVNLDEGQWGEAHSPPVRVFARPLVFVRDKSGVFDPSLRIDVHAGIGEVKVDVEADLRIEREPPPSPAQPP